MDEKHFPPGTTWQQVYDAFDQLARLGVSGAKHETLSMELINHGGNVDMPFEEEILQGFRRKYDELMALAQRETE